MSARNPHGNKGAGTPGAPPSPYDEETLRALNALTAEFYAREAASFSATRQAPWHGWDRTLAAIAAIDPSFPERPLAVLDLACGNLRFEAFLAERDLPVAHVAALDLCPALAQSGGIAHREERTCASGPGPTSAPASAEPFPIEFHEADLMGALIDRGTLAPLLPDASCDLAVAFGFMHHVAAPALRVAVVRDLLGSLRPGGLAVLSFWQFMHDPRIAAKAAAATAAGRAERQLPLFAPNDYLLGWQHAENVYRFCHHTSDSEIDALLVFAGAMPGKSSASPRVETGAATATDATTATAAGTFREVARFSADGKRGNLNRYVILRREGAEGAPIC